MKWLGLGAAAALTMILGFSLPAAAQNALPFPGAGAATDIPGAKEMPDPALDYKIVFNVTKAAAKPDGIVPGLGKIEHYYNTLAHEGVPADHIHFVAVVHGDAIDAILTDAEYGRRHHGMKNPDLPTMKKMKAMGIDFRTCGQGVLANKIDPKTITPEVQLNLWAWVTITNMRLRGYVNQNL